MPLPARQTALRGRVAVIEKVADQYSRVKFDALALVEPSYGHRPFASATRGDGHQSYIQFKASFVMVYYVRVFDEAGNASVRHPHLLQRTAFAKGIRWRGHDHLPPSSRTPTPTKYEGLRATIVAEFEPAPVQAAPTC